MKTEVTKVISNHAEYYNSNSTRNISFRLHMLQKLQRAIVENEARIYEALKLDLRKSQFESYETEIGIVLEEIRIHIKNLQKWSKNKPVSTPLAHFPSKSYISPEPLGTVLIIAPWNYPFQLLIAPLVGAISAGNCVVLKPAQYSENTSKLIAEIIQKTFEERYISVFLGGREVNAELLRHKYDYIFFTGSATLGKIVMQAAAENLTPLTLELGGKSPCVITADADLKIAATRLVWGKFLNSGQTCVAPDYLLVESSVKKEFLTYMKEEILRFYGNDPQKSPDYPRIINEAQHTRLVSLIQNGNIVVGGTFDRDDLYIAPTILENVSLDSPLMSEEIFGPILPVIEWTGTDEMISFITTRPKPLAFYLFTSNNNFKDYVFSRISCGGACVNDTIVHLANPKLPFGGVGLSGMGKYHAKASFDLFSNMRSVLQKSTKLDIPIRYPPYNDKLKFLKWFLK